MGSGSGGGGVGVGSEEGGQAKVARQAGRQEER